MSTTARKKIAAIEINHEWCKRCGICVSFCPKTVFDADIEGVVSVPRLEDCIYCELCERMCPDLAITLVPQKQQEETS